MFADMASGPGKFLSSLASLTLDTGLRDDDIIDRLNHSVMYGFLLTMAFITGTKQYVGSPINCWLPAQYRQRFQAKYANSHCLVSTLYNIPLDDTFPVAEENRDSNFVKYYRWATLMFITLAFLFRVPQLLWNELKHTSGVNVDKLIGLTLETSLMGEEDREKQLGHVADFFHRWVTSRVRQRRHGPYGFLQLLVENTIFCYGKRSGHHLVFTYIFIKLLYFVNTVGQFIIVSCFLNTNYLWFGLHVWNTYYQRGEWAIDYIFPRVALCDMKIRQMQNLHTYTIQCVLPINLFLEKMFLIFWFLLLCVLIANTISLLRWIHTFICGIKTRQFLKDFSRQLFPEMDSYRENRRIVDMLERYMRPDGIFVLRMVSGNTSNTLTLALMRQIWLRYNVLLKANTNNSTIRA